MAERLFNVYRLAEVGARNHPHHLHHPSWCTFWRRERASSLQHVQAWRDGSEETLPPSQLVYILAPRSRISSFYMCRPAEVGARKPSPHPSCGVHSGAEIAHLPFYMYRPAEMGARTPSTQLHQRSLADAGAPLTHPPTFAYRLSRPFFTIVFFGASASYATRPPPGNSQPTPTGGSRLHMPCFLQASVGLVVLRERCDG